MLLPVKQLAKYVIDIDGLKLWIVKCTSYMRNNSIFHFPFKIQCVMKFMFVSLIDQYGISSCLIEDYLDVKKTV